MTQLIALLYVYLKLILNIRVSFNKGT